MSSPVSFPSPIGGVPFDLDFGPSILFAALYGIVVVGSFYRLLRSSSRTITTIGTFCFTIERVVIFALRAKQAHSPWEDNSRGLTKYWQISFAGGYLSMISDVCNILQSLFVKTTLAPSEEYPMSSPAAEEDDSKTAVNVKTTSAPVSEGQVALRVAYRKMFGLPKLLVLIPTATGIVAGTIYTSSETNTGTANTVQALRYVTAALAFLLILHLQVRTLWGYYNIANIRKSSALIGFALASLLNITSIYRLVAMHNHTTSLTSTAPGSLNTPSEKALFYVFHAAPDFLAATALLVINVRERFSTGLLGDVSRWKRKKRSSKTPEAHCEDKYHVI